MFYSAGRGGEPSMSCRFFHDSGGGNGGRLRTEYIAESEMKDGSAEVESVSQQVVRFGHIFEFCTFCRYGDEKESHPVWCTVVPVLMSFYGEAE